MFFEQFSRRKKEAKMLWIEADLVEIGSTKRLLNLRNEIFAFATSNSDRKLAIDSVRFWDEERRIVLPFRTGSVIVDLSFLLGIVKLSSLCVVTACKKWSLQKRGYELLGFHIGDNELEIVEKQNFSGFGSDYWQVLKIGDDGYSACVHVQGAVSVWRFFIDQTGTNIFLNRKLALLLKDKRIFSSTGNLRKAMFNKHGIDADDIERLADNIYTCYRSIQGVLVSQDLAANKSRNVAP
ncbi:MAG: hypothetical protein PHN19_02350 [Patescibacteria group bacterium]|nr:hypothetical protein [Patescibacteria group bacterium]